MHIEKERKKETKKERKRERKKNNASNGISESEIFKVSSAVLDWIELLVWV
jgi:hypothetical protein